MARAYGTRYGTGLLRIRLDQFGDAIGLLAGKDIEMLPAPGRAGEGEAADNPTPPTRREAWEWRKRAIEAEKALSDQRAGEGEGEAGKRAKRDEGLADVKARNPSNLVAYSWGFGDGWDARAGEPPTPIIGDEIRLLTVLRDFRGLMFFDRLVERGLVRQWPSGYEITAEGRAALDAARQEAKP